MEIYKDDIVYIYEYKNRKEKNDFYNLIPIKVTESVDNKVNIIASGINLDENYQELKDDNGNFIKTSGIVEYKKEGNFLIKGNKKYYISYKKDKKGYLFNIERYEGTDLFSIYICLKLDDNFVIKTRLNYICFDRIEKIEDFLSLINISRIQLHETFIQLICNKQKWIYLSYEVYYKDNLISNDYKRKLFQYACSNKNDITGAKYDFNKVFSLKNVGYEICKEKI